MQYLGGDGDSALPLSIPNREVKPISAENTGFNWENRSPPGLSAFALSPFGDQRFVYDDPNGRLRDIAYKRKSSPERVSFF